MRPKMREHVKEKGCSVFVVVCVTLVVFKKVFKGGHGYFMKTIINN